MTILETVQDRQSDIPTLKSGDISEYCSCYNRSQTESAKCAISDYLNEIYPVTAIHVLQAFANAIIICDIQSFSIMQ